MKRWVDFKYAILLKQLVHYIICMIIRQPVSRCVLKSLLPKASLLVFVLSSCATPDSSTINPNLMTDEEIIAYNKTQDRIWDHIVCTREIRVQSHIKKRYCGTLSQLNRRASATGEQLNIISFGGDLIYR